MSSQLSFQTAVEMQSSQLSALSSIISTEPETESKSPYRAAKQLPYELREHCLIYFEEELCIVYPMFFVP